MADHDAVGAIKSELGDQRASDPTTSQWSADRPGHPRWTSSAASSVVAPNHLWMTDVTEPPRGQGLLLHRARCVLMARGRPANRKHTDFRLGDQGTREGHPTGA